jgi:AbrB family looped-hinge helix DNA binding protein
MAKVTVTRGSQITLTRAVREKLGIKEGDVVTVNTLGGLAVIAKQDPAAWRRAKEFLPERFERTLERIRSDSSERLKRLGLA